MTYRYKIIILLFTLFSLHSASVFSKSTNFSNDTIQKFISVYGKDSLVRLIDKSIAKGSKFIGAYEQQLSIADLALEIKAVGKHYQLGFDTLPFRNAISDFAFTRIYDEISGEQKQIDTLNEISDKAIKGMPSDTLNKLFLKDINDLNILKLLNLYCEKMNISNYLFVTIYSKSKH